MKSTTIPHRLCMLSIVGALILLGGNLEGSDMDTTLTNEKIKKMAEKGLGHQTIIAMIETRPGKYDVSTRKLYELKRAGVNDEVLAALVKAAKNTEGPARVQPLFGPGLTWLLDDHVDFREEDGTILIDNDSEYRPELMAGTVIKICDFGKDSWRHKPTFDIVTGLQFTKGGQALVDGVFFGVGLGLTPNVEFVVGYSRSLGKELSFGFKRNMGQFIKEQKEKKQLDPELQGIRVAGGVIENIQDYDGLSLYRDNEKQQKIFPGNPIINSFNSRISIGLLFKFDIVKAFEKVVH